MSGQEQDLELPVYCYMRSSFYRSFPSQLFFLSLASAAWGTVNRYFHTRRLQGQAPAPSDVVLEYAGSASDIDKRSVDPSSLS